MNTLFFIQSLLHQLVEWDKKLFLFINQKATHPLLDNTLPSCRESKNWIPLYIALLAFVIWKFKKKCLAWILFFLITIVLTDQISSHIFKPLVARLRPCTDPEFMQQVRLLLAHCSTAFSFTSSHAANHFGMATFICCTWKYYKIQWRYVWFVWAAIISYAQIYVGVHYPLDVFCGALIGIAIGWASSKLYLMKLNKK